MRSGRRRAASRHAMPSSCASAPRIPRGRSRRRPGSSPAGVSRRDRASAMDSGFEDGWRVSGDYDPLLAKLLVVAPDRDGAIARRCARSTSSRPAGFRRRIPFHRWLLTHRGLPAGRAAHGLGRGLGWEPGADSAARRPSRRQLVAASRSGGMPVEALPRWIPGHVRTTAGAGSRARGVDDGRASTDRPPVVDGDRGPSIRGRRSPDWTHAGRREATERWPWPRTLRMATDGAGPWGSGDRASPVAVPRTLVIERPRRGRRRRAGRQSGGPPGAATSASDRADGRRRYEGHHRWLGAQRRTESAARAALRERARQGRRGERPTGGPLQVKASIPGRVVRSGSTAATPSGRPALLAIEAMKMENEVRAPRAGTVESYRRGRGCQPRARRRAARRR